MLPTTHEIELPPIPATANPALSGPRAPIRAEWTAVGPFAINGALPPALEGLLLWLGPNPAVVDDPDHYDPVDGDGMLHGLEIRDGGVAWAGSRLVVTGQLYNRLGGKAPSGPLSAAGPVANAALALVAGRLVALDGRGLGYRISTELSTIMVEDFDSMLSSPMGSQVETDPTTGTAIFLGLDMFGPPFLRYHEVTRDGLFAFSDPIPFGPPGAEPALGVTATTLAIVESSIRGQLDGEGDLLDGARMLDLANAPAVGLLPRRTPGNEIVWCSSIPSHTSRVLAMADSSEGALLHVVQALPQPHDDPSWRPQGRQGHLSRLEVDATARIVRASVLDDLELDDAAGDVSVAMDDRRRVYAVTADGRVLVKYDITDGTRERRELDAGQLASRPIFLRDPDGRSDEEGWVVCVLLDTPSMISSILVLDATRFTGRPEALIRMPQRVPIDLTAIFISAQQLR